ncbi:MAG: DnaJ domain-containing protein [Deltaproteobacteria bacterium]|nr:DnaJ domain-containing protein [Deltaproteobacteria bacterium]
MSETIEGLGRKKDPVKLKPGVDITTLKLSPEEGFLVSRISPGDTLESLLAVCGIPEPKAVVLLRGLIERGVVVGPSEVAGAGGMEAHDFDRAALAEATDLPEEIKKELLYREDMAGKWHHYEVLGLRPTATKDEIQKAYFALVRRLHPDRFYGKEMGSFAERLDRVVQRIRDAYETLSNAQRRAEYDRKTEFPLTFEELEALEEAQEKKLRDERRKVERRERLRKRAPLGERKRKATQFANEARKAASKEDWRQAANLYRLALTYDPGNEAMEALLEEADALSASTRAEDLLDRARSAEALGNLQEAEELLREAVKADPAGSNTLLTLVRFLLARGAKPDTVLGMAQKVTYLDRHSVEGWTLYGRVLVQLGEKSKAKKAFEQAVDLDETADEAKEALKKLRWTLF